MIKDKDNYKGSKNYNFRYFRIFFLVLFIISVLVFFIIEKEIRNIKFEEAYKSMIRFSTPVYDRMCNNNGIIVINYLADKVLENSI